MNETRRAALEQIAAIIKAETLQLMRILDAEQTDVRDMPDNIENSEYAERTRKRPMNELRAALIKLHEAAQHIDSSIARTGMSL